MNKIGRPEIKDENTLTIQNEINAIETIANVYFKDEKDSDGNIVTKYTPYFEKIGQVTAIAKYFISGLEFDKGENIYESVMSDGNVYTLVDKFFVPYDKKVDTFTFPQMVLNNVMKKVNDIVEYRKAINIAQIQNESNSTLTYKLLELIEKETEKNEKEIQAAENYNAWIDEQREQQEKINAIVTPEMQKNFIENFDVNDIAKAIYKQLSDGDLHKKEIEIREANRTIRNQENKIIDDLQNEFAKKQQKENVKNVLSDTDKK